MAITAGTQFDHYEILAPLGAGGMGEVYAARDTRLDRAVAVKVLPASFAHDADRLRRFEQEARATSALNHPNILTVDFSQNQLTGEPVRLTEQVQIDGNSYVRSSLSTNGVLVLIEGNTNGRLAWFDRSGKRLGTVGPAGIYAIPRLSSDGQRLAVGRRNPQTQASDIHLFDLARGTESRFTFDPADDEFPLWSPDNSRIV